MKHNVENIDDPGSSSYKGNEEFHPIKAEQIEPPNGIGNLSAKKNDRLHTTRYFIIKSLNHHNIQLSSEKGIWATQAMNESILEEAFHNSGKVILIFSVNMSGFFQGYAQMMSTVGWRRDNVWVGASGGSNPWGRTFKVKWLQLHNLPFQKTLHLKNPLNDYKPVKISRDCQELSQDIGEALCELIDGRVDVDGNLKRNSSSRDELPRRLCVESPVCLPDEYVQTAPPSHTGWARTPMLHPSLLYQHVMQAQASNFHEGYGKCPRGYSREKLETNFEASEGSQMKYSHIHGDHTNILGYGDTFSPWDDRHLFAERRSFADSLSEDDFLEMTYEEYLQVHGRSSNPSHYLVVGPSCTSGEHDDDG